MRYRSTKPRARKRMVTLFAAIALGGGLGLGIHAAAATGASAPGGPADASATAAPTDTATPTDTPAPTDTGSPTDAATASPSATSTDHDHGVLTADDYIDINQVPPAAAPPRTQRGGSSGVFSSRCGRNLNGHRNPDNFIVAPGVSDGAHHTHDYVGNLSTDGNSTDASLAAAGTTCRLGDKSTYFWPVLRDVTQSGDDADAPGGGADANLGKILTPASVQIQFRGNPVSKVTAMPRFLRIITGDAKAVTNGPDAPNARAQWTCSGARDRISSTQYPLCGDGQQVMRIEDFASCWDGQNTDSGNHRTHVVFPDRQTGACPAGTKAIPQLRIVLSYQVPPGLSFALDTFPEQQRKAVTDHSDFENLMPTALMRLAVVCINRGLHCG
jgi:Domain of unknown function (DUF1996)